MPKIDYDDLCEVLRNAQRLMEILGTVSFDDMQDPKVDKRCGTCNNYMQVRKGKVCSISLMGNDHVTQCTDWTGKSIGEKRVWTCLNCEKDIFYSKDINRYFHKNDACGYCENWQKEIERYFTPIEGLSHVIAIPKPDSERWFDNDLKEKPLYKKQVWTCANCGEDIIYVSSYYSYHHLKNGIINCDIEKKVAIPKPDSERWVECNMIDYSFIQVGVDEEEAWQLFVNLKYVSKMKELLEDYGMAYKYVSEYGMFVLTTSDLWEHDEIEKLKSFVGKNWKKS